jgi:Lar family restriction alleviation protein
MTEGLIKPCAHCGSTEVSLSYATNLENVISHRFVECEECGACGPTDPSEKKAITAWNTRTPAGEGGAKDAVERAANESGDLKALCKQLRKRVFQVPGPVDPVLVNPNGPQAADTIERLQADLERAVEVMKPFAEAGDKLEETQWFYEEPDEVPVELIVNAGEVRAARSFIASRRGG